MIQLNIFDELTVKDIAQMCLEKGEDGARKYIYIKACIEAGIPSCQPEESKMTLRTKRLMALDSLDRVVTSPQHIPKVQALLDELASLTVPISYDYNLSIRYVNGDADEYTKRKLELSYLDVASKTDATEYKNKLSSYKPIGQATLNTYEHINRTINNLFDDWYSIVQKGKHCEELLEDITSTGVATDKDACIKLIATMLHENIETIEDAMCVHNQYSQMQYAMWSVEPEEVI